MEYTCFDLEIKDKIAHIKMSRPDEFNSMNKAFWSELPHLVESISDDASARVIVLSGEGKHFCAGMDLANFSPSEKQPNAHMGMRKESGYRVTCKRRGKNVMRPLVSKCNWRSVNFAFNFVTIRFVDLHYFF